MELALVEAAVTEVRIGRQAENGFKRESYVRMQMEVNLQNKGKMLEVLQVKSKLALLKKKFETFAEICRCSGFGWDDVRGMPTADEKTWDTYIAAYPKAKEFRHKPFKFYEELKEVFAGKSATGANSVAPSQLSSVVNDSPVGSEVIWPLSDDEAVTTTARKRGRDDSAAVEVSSDDDSHPARQVAGRTTQPRKRVRHRKKSTGKAIADALVQMSDTATRTTAMLTESKTERAIEVFLKEYDVDRMPSAKRQRVLQLFEDSVKATCFLSLKPGVLRDEWINYQTGNTVEEEEESE